MKKLFYTLMAVCMLCTTGMLTSCSGDDEVLQEVTIDLDNLYGTWQNNAVRTEYWHYSAEAADDAGYCQGHWWDTTEFSEEQSLTGTGLFKWIFDEKTGLMRIHWQQASGGGSYGAPEPLDPSIIEELTPTRLTYKDATGTRRSFTKVN